MTTATPEPSNTAIATCQTCGQLFHYEPIFAMGHDLAAALHRQCESCAAVSEKHEAKKIAEQRRAEIMARISSIIPEDLRETYPDHPDFNAKLWQAVKSWRPSSSSFWLGIVGHAGKSKTRCMALLAIKAMHAGIQVAWTTAHRIKDAADDRKSWDRQTQTAAREHLEECKRAAWLFIDDLGKTEWNAAFEAEIFKLLDHRKTHRLATVFSSNAHPEEFSQLISVTNSMPIIGRLLDRTALLEVSA